MIVVSAGASDFSFTATDNGGPAGFLALQVQLNGDIMYFINFRKHPKHDFGEVINGQIRWDLVYATCLRHYYVLFPAMSKRIPLND